MKAFLSSVCVICLVILSLFILEGACFRLVEDYAQKRLELAWGQAGSRQFHPILKKLPLDHYVLPPRASDLTSSRIPLENDYAAKVMSFGRPIRDRLKEQVETDINPLEDFEIKDLNGVESVLLPGLQKPATLNDVRRKLARRIDDPLEFAKGLVIRVVQTDENHILQDEFNRLTSVFKLLLENGFACTVMPSTSGSQLLGKSKRLRSENPMIADNLYLWGDGLAADFILETTTENPSIFKSIVVSKPHSIGEAPMIKGMPWMLFGISPDLQEERQLSNLLTWIDRGRDADRLYPSRLGGLMKFTSQGDEFGSFAAVYFLQVLKYVESIGANWPTPTPLLKGMATEQERSLSNGNPLQTSRDSKKGFDLLNVERKIEQIQKSENANPSITDTFDCEIVRVYRETHTDDLNLRRVSNRDLVLKLGMSFEQMGEEVLESMGEKDPLFLRFYKSLREVRSSPLN